MVASVHRSRIALGVSVIAGLGISASAAGCGPQSEDPSPLVEQSIGETSQALNSGFRLPFACGYSTTVTQGNNTNFSHQGVSAYGFDFGVPLNTPLVASKAGRVTYARNDVKPGNPCYSGGGQSCINTLNYVTIDHGDGTSTVYAHLNVAEVAVGTTVKQGQRIGLSGGTGWSTGPHTHLQRQQNCGAFYCQSVPLSFDDVPGAGVPTGGTSVKSMNSCSGDCAIGDGYYCGGNGVKGDKASLFLCKGGTPTLAEKCAYGCSAMPPGVDDRCATAAEAPDAGPPDAGGSNGGDGGDGSATDAGAPEDSTDDEGSPARPPLPSRGEGEETAGCATAPGGRPRGASGSAAVIALGLAGVLLGRIRSRRGASRR